MNINDEIKALAIRLSAVDGYGPDDLIDISYGSATGSADPVSDGIALDPAVKIAKSVQVRSKAPAWYRYIPDAVRAHKANLA